MKLLTSLLFFIPFYISAQVGTGTLTPKGMLDISSGDSGLVIPRVTSIEDVTDGNGNSAIDGTVVYDISRSKTCFKIDGEWVCIDDAGGIAVEEVIDCTNYFYLKPDVTQNGDFFGKWSVSAPKRSPGDRTWNIHLVRNEKFPTYF